jgi:hypothetical protein
VRAQDVEEVLRIGERAWLERRLRASNETAAGAAPPPEPVAGDPPVQPVGDALSWVVMNMPVPKGGLAPGGAPRNLVPVRLLNSDPRMLRAAEAGLMSHLSNLVRLKLDRAIRSEQQLDEVMTDFWFNHFNVLQR